MGLGLRRVRFDVCGVWIEERARFYIEWGPGFGVGAFKLTDTMTCWPDEYWASGISSKRYASPPAFEKPENLLNHQNSIRRDH